MGISKEIQQTVFRSENHKAIVNIIFSSNWLLEKIKNYLEKEDITHQQYNILRILRGSIKPLSTQQIRERMIDKMSDTSRIVERLLKKEYVHKVVCAHDKRLVDVTITPKGMQLLDRLDKDTGQMDSIVSALSLEDAEALNNLLDKMRDNAPVATQ